MPCQMAAAAEVVLPDGQIYTSKISHYHKHAAYVHGKDAVKHHNCNLAPLLLKHCCLLSADCRLPPEQGQADRH